MQIPGRGLREAKRVLAKRRPMKGERRVDVIEFLAIASALGADPLRLLKRIMGRVREI